MDAILKRFNSWADTLEFNRLLVMAVIILIHTCVVTPPTLLVLLHAQAGGFPYLVITFFSFLILVVNLAVMPTKVTIPIFAISTLAHLMIIGYYLTLL